MPAAPTPVSEPPPSVAKPLWLRILPLAVLLAGLAAFFALGGHHYLSFEQIKLYRTDLMAWVGRWGARPRP